MIWGLSFISFWVGAGLCRGLYQSEKIRTFGIWLRTPTSKLRNQWPLALQLLSGILKSGLNLDGALDIFLAETPDPLRFYIKAKLPPNYHLLPLSMKIEKIFEAPFLRDLKIALRLSHEWGHEPSLLIESVNRRLLKKREMKEKIKILSAQGKLTAWVVGLSPLFLMGLLWKIQPDFVNPFFETNLGLRLLGLMLIMIGAGLFFVYRMATFDE